MRILPLNAGFISRVVAYLYIIALCIFWLADNYAAGYINWFMITLVIFSTFALAVRKKTTDIIIGWILTVGSMYMMLAVMSAHSRAIAHNHPEAAGKVLTYGILIFCMGIASGMTLLLRSYLGAGRGWGK